MAIKNSLQRFSSNRTEENREYLLSDIAKSELLVPVRWLDEQTFRILHIQDAKGDAYLPILTDINEQLPPLYERDSFRLERVRFSDCIQLLESSHQVKGIVLNPMLENIILPSILFSSFLPAKEQQVSFGIPNKDYSWLTEPLISFLRQSTNVRHVYLLIIVRENQPIATLVVDGDEKNCLAIVDYLNQQEYSEIIDIIPLQTEFSKEIIKGITPFYSEDI